MVSLNQLLSSVIEQNASDLHLVSGSAPVLRVNGSIVRVKSDLLHSEDVKKICYGVLSDRQKAVFEESHELDFSFGVKDMARFRGNLSYQMGSVSAVFRRIPNSIPDLDDLGIPSVVKKFTEQPSGLILVTGATGSGKSTSIASMINLINEREHGTIYTIEDPIEYIHSHKNCIVRQREVGSDTSSFSSALKHLLRQDPDYCLIGELRDLETIEAALTVAETGHLVFASLHTNSAIQTMNRLVQVFPGDQKEKIRIQLSFVVQGILSQQLLPSLDGELVLASEVLVPTPGIRNLIRENKLHQIQSLMQMGQEQTGMVTMNQSLVTLLLKRKIDMKTAFKASSDPEELDRMLRKAGI